MEYMRSMHAYEWKRGPKISIPKNEELSTPYEKKKREEKNPE